MAYYDEDDDAADAVETIDECRRRVIYCIAAYYDGGSRKFDPCPIDYANWRITQFR